MIVLLRLCCSVQVELMPVIEEEGLNHFLGPVGILLQILPSIHSLKWSQQRSTPGKLCLLTHTNISEMCHHRLIKFLFKGIVFQVFIPILIYLLSQESKHRYSGVILLQYKYDFGRKVFFQICLSQVHTHIPLFTSHGFP